MLLINVTKHFQSHIYHIFFITLRLIAHLHHQYINIKNVYISSSFVSLHKQYCCDLHVPSLQFLTLFYSNLFLLPHSFIPYSLSPLIYPPTYIPTESLKSQHAPSTEPLSRLWGDKVNISDLCMSHRQFVIAPRVNYQDQLTPSNK